MPRNQLLKDAQYALVNTAASQCIGFPVLCPAVLLAKSMTAPLLECRYSLVLGLE